MIHFQESRILPYGIDKVYALISNIEAYPAFVPWCKKCTITDRLTNTNLICEMDVGFEAIATSYTSKVTLIPPHQVLVTGTGDLFQHLATDWSLKSVADDMTYVTFTLTFLFKSDTLHAIAQGAFKRIASKIINAFENEIKRNMSK